MVYDPNRDFRFPPSDKAPLIDPPAGRERDMEGNILEGQPAVVDPVEDPASEPVLEPVAPLLPLKRPLKK